MGITPDQFRMMQARVQPPPATQPALIPTGDDLEADLHEMIESWCRRQDPQVPYGHARMDKKSTYTPGWADFTLLLPGGKTLLIECKVGDNDLSEDQEKFRAEANAVGHPVVVCRDYDSFLSTVKHVMSL